MIDRGGLVTASDFLFAIVGHAYHVYEKIFFQHEIYMKFMSFCQPREVFKELLQSLLIKHRYERLECDEGHSFGKFIPAIGQKIFNIFSKNFIGQKMM